MHRTTLVLRAAIAMALLLLPVAALAQQWPQRAVRFIVPLPPGGGTDIAARLVAERLAERWGQPVVVENRQGGDGIPAVTGFLSSRDDHSFLFSFAGIVTTNPLVYDKLPYDPRELVPVCAVADNFIAIAAAAKLGLNSLAQYVERARARPGELNWAATPGVPQYVFSALQKSAAITVQQVPYRDFMPALQDLGEGRIDAAATGLPLLMPLVRAGKAKLLMVTNRQRSPLAPDVPTAEEAGYPDLTFDGVVGLYALASISAELKERITADVNAVAVDPLIAQRLAAAGAAVRTGTSQAFGASIDEQRRKVAALAEAVKAKP